MVTETHNSRQKKKKRVYLFPFLNSCSKNFVASLAPLSYFFSSSSAAITVMQKSCQNLQARPNHLCFRILKNSGTSADCCAIEQQSCAQDIREQDCAKSATEVRKCLFQLSSRALVEFQHYKQRLYCLLL